MTSLRSLMAGAAILLGMAATSSTAAASPAEDALAELRGETVDKDVVQNRFFEKSKRFEIAPVIGLVPNNPMVKRYTGGVLLAYHFSETFAVGGQIIYSPDLGNSDLKDLTNTLVQIAHNGSSDIEFQQPLDKVTLGATFSANWIPVYGKINLVGETVLNFDLYGSAGLGMLSVAKYYAVYSEEIALTDPTKPPVTLAGQENVVRVPLNLAVGADFFLTQTLALKIEARSFIYIDGAPQYDPDLPTNDKQVYPVIITSAGLSMYFPKMPDRISNF